MDLTSTQQVLLYGFGIAVIMGAVVNRTNFCTMGAVSDWVNMGDTGRMRSWMFAIAVAIAGVTLLGLFGAADISVTSSGSQAFPPYRTFMFAWPRYLVGGFLFGIGMTLASGCSNKTMVRIGGGNIKSLLVLLTLGFGAYLMMYTNFMAYVFYPWMQPAFVDLSRHGVSDQSLGGLIAGAFGLGSESTVNYVLGGLLALVLLVWAFKSVDFRSRFDNILGGAVVGLAVVGAWYVTAGPLGKRWMDDVAFMDRPPAHAAAQSYTFVSPAGDLFHWVDSGFYSKLLSFGMLAAAGVIVGSLLYALVTRQFRFEWFSSWVDAVRHAVGGFLMGVGGVLGMGCTIGQGVTGFSTLALGSIMAFGAIVLGAALTMKVEYYRLVYEGEASFMAALLSALADLRLVPNALRRLEAV
ncbi:MAG TPA: YeeE/YedE family protein [Gammaproteobacteria bacterium]|nr:YeeE/YedE family protein [Gammaproteobacteria bacterium]